MYLSTLMLLGSGELGREFAIAAKRLGCRVIACDRYDNAPAMQVADEREVFPMLDGAALRAAVEKHRPDHIVPGDRGDRHGDAGRAGARGLACRPLGQGGPADHEPRRHPRLRGEGAWPHDVTLSLRRNPRRGGRRRRNRRPSRRGQAGHVVERQGPEHRPHGGRARHGLRLCRRQHARRPAPGDRRGVHRLRL